MYKAVSVMVLKIILHPISIGIYIRLKSQIKMFVIGWKKALKKQVKALVMMITLWVYQQLMMGPTLSLKCAAVTNLTLLPTVLIMSEHG
jgi:hypothetical protein